MNRAYINNSDCKMVSTCKHVHTQILIKYKPKEHFYSSVTVKFQYMNTQSQTNIYLTMLTTYVSTVGSHII